MGLGKTAACSKDMGASLKDLPVAKWNNLSNKIYNRELDYNPKYKRDIHDHTDKWLHNKEGEETNLPEEFPTMAVDSALLEVWPYSSFPPSDFLPPQRTGKRKGEITTFSVEKLHRHHIMHMRKVSITSGKFFSGTMLPCATTWCLRTSNPSLTHEKTSEKLEIGGHSRKYSTSPLQKPSRSWKAKKDENYQKRPNNCIMGFWLILSRKGHYVGKMVKSTSSMHQCSFDKWPVVNPKLWKKLVKVYRNHMIFTTFL